MKELSIEQKAQAYDNLIKRLKDFQSKYRFKTIDEYFPELKKSEESKDEKIRKAIGYAIGQSTHSDGTLINVVSSEEALSWLEKQGEHANFRNKIQIGDKVTRNEDGVLVNLSQLNRVAKKQGEQKPAWSEEDEQMFEHIIEKATLKFSEWNCLKNDEINFLKSLHPQNKQEWTQDDIDMIDWLIRCCEKEHEELCNDRYGHQDIVSDLKRDCRKKWDWLESLKERVAPQSHWKPSEEQIKAVKEAACYSSVFSEKTIDNLISLSKQLKKLMVE